MIHSSHDIDQLLERYYDGVSTPDEEFVLYLALLQEEPRSPYYADRMLLDTAACCLTDEELRGRAIPILSSHPSLEGVGA